MKHLYVLASAASDKGPISLRPIGSFNTWREVNEAKRGLEKPQLARVYDDTGNLLRPRLSA